MKISTPPPHSLLLQVTSRIGRQLDPKSLLPPSRGGRHCHLGSPTSPPLGLVGFHISMNSQVSCSEESDNQPI
ncbi:hypothetical protein CapIbe_006924 [Capra ibex]